MSTLARDHREAITFAIEEYRQAAILIWQDLAEGGQIPGVELVTPAEIRQFFREVPVEEWQRLARENPEAALRALRDFAEVEE